MTGLPRTLALIDDDVNYGRFLASTLRDSGITVDVFRSSYDLIAAQNPFDYGFYVVDLLLTGIDGVELVQLVRRRSNAGVLVVSSTASTEVFKDVVDAGADMMLAKPLPLAEVLIAIEAVQRRAAPSAAGPMEWVLERRAGQLVAPDGTRVTLSDIDRAVLECFAEAAGDVVSRDSLRQRVRKVEVGDAPDGLNAIIYRLRRRIERATPLLVPLQSKSRVGYQFRAPLRVV